MRNPIFLALAFTAMFSFSAKAETVQIKISQEMVGNVKVNGVKNENLDIKARLTVFRELAADANDPTKRRGLLLITVNNLVALSGIVSGSQVDLEGGKYQDYTVEALCNSKSMQNGHDKITWDNFKCEISLLHKLNPGSRIPAFLVLNDTFF